MKQLYSGMNMTSGIQRLRSQAISRSLFPPTSLKSALDKLTFVQADPIRSPARAQDLILRHRIKGYHVGDLERQSSALGLEEDFLYAHGYMLHEIWQLLHPRNKVRLTKLDQQVLEIVRQSGQTHPKNLVSHFTKKRVRNSWSGHSQATKMALDRLHYYGLIRISGRKNGIRIYQAITSGSSSLPTNERLNRLIMAIVHILSPVTNKTLTQPLHRLRRHFGDTRPVIKDLLHSGELEQQTIDGLIYLWSVEKIKKVEIPQTVRFLTPFDPVVWDRLRFEHLWGWPYRFEAYTPAAKRIRGYYAMPLLWGDDIIGWANATMSQGELKVETGFIDKPPQDKLFQTELTNEIERLKDFL